MRRQSLRSCQSLLLAAAIISNVAFAAISCPGHGHHESDVLLLRVGMSCGMSGQHRSVCERVKKGMQLLKDTVREKAPFRADDGRNIVLQLDILDDKGSQEEVERIYHELVASSCYDALIGPYGDGLASIAANIAHRDERVIMLHNAMTPAVTTLYEDQDYKTVFSTAADAALYMRDGLDALYQVFARDVGGQMSLYIAEKADARAIAICNGVEAWAHNQGLNVNVLNRARVRAVEMTLEVHDMIHQMVRLNPSVFVLCGNRGDAVNMVVTSRALGFSPKAMLMVGAAEYDFLEAVGAPNAQYLLGPVTWHPSRDYGARCRVFGSASEFDQLYKSKFGKHSDPETAGAVGAAIALLAAVERIHHTLLPTSPTVSWAPGIVEQQTLRNALENMNEPSFIGNLVFKHGLLKQPEDRMGVTVQWFPLDKSMDPALRYTTVSQQLIGRTTISYPMPSWIAKEASVYPCEPGKVRRSQQVDSDGHDTMNMCESCPVGRFREQHSLFCRQCPANTYSYGIGNYECQPCPSGARCSQGGVAMAEAGYYRLNLTPPVFAKCQDPAICLGDNRCTGHNTGILCANCETGYTNWQGAHQTAECAECASRFKVTLWYLVTFCVHCCSVAVMFRFADMSSNSLHSTQGVVLKLIVSHMQLMAIALDTSEFELSGFLVFVTGMAQNPAKRVLYLACPQIFWENAGHVVFLRIIFGWIAIPLMVLVNGTWWLCILYKRWWRFRIELDEKVEAIEVCRLKAAGVDVRAYQRRRQDVQDVFYDDDDGRPSADASEILPHEQTDGLERQMWLSVDKTFVDSMRCACVWTFFLYPIITSMLLEVFNVIQLDRADVFRLKSDLSIDVHSERFMEWAWFSGLGFVVLGLGIPAGLVAILYRQRHQLNNLRVRQVYGFFFDGYNTECYYFEAIMMLRKCAIMVCAVMPTKYQRLLWTLIVAFFFFGVNKAYEPYDTRDFNVCSWLDWMSSVSLIVILCSQLVYAIRQDFIDMPWAVVSATIEQVENSALFLTFVGLNLGFFALAIWTLYRNVVLKPLEFKAECMPDCLTVLERRLLMLDKQVNKVVFDLETHKLNLSALTDLEKQHFHKTLCSVLELYLFSAANFHPGRLVTALRESFALAIRDRRLRAAELHRQHGRETFRIASPSEQLSSRRYKSHDSLMQLPEEACVYASERAWERSSQAVLDEQNHPDTPVDAVHWRMMRRSATQAETWNSVTVEELHNSSMLLEADIVEHHPRLFTIEVPPRQSCNEDEDVDVDDCFWILGRTYSETPQSFVRSSLPHAEVLASAAKPLHVDSSFVVRRQISLDEDRDGLCGEITMLRRRLSAVKEERNIRERRRRAERRRQRVDVTRQSEDAANCGETHEARSKSLPRAASKPAPERCGMAALVLQLEPLRTAMPMASYMTDTMAELEPTGEQSSTAIADEHQQQNCVTDRGGVGARGSSNVGAHSGDVDVQSAAALDSNNVGAFREREAGTQTASGDHASPQFVSRTGLVSQNVQRASPSSDEPVLLPVTLDAPLLEKIYEVDSEESCTEISVEGSEEWCGNHVFSIEDAPYVLQSLAAERKRDRPVSVASMTDTIGGHFLSSSLRPTQASCALRHCPGPVRTSVTSRPTRSPQRSRSPNRSGTSSPSRSPARTPRPRSPPVCGSKEKLGWRSPERVAPYAKKAFLAKSALVQLVPQNQSMEAMSPTFPQDAARDSPRAVEARMFGCGESEGRCFPTPKVQIARPPTPPEEVSPTFPQDAARDSPRAAEARMFGCGESEGRCLPTPKVQIARPPTPPEEVSFHV